MYKDNKDEKIVSRISKIHFKPFILASKDLLILVIVKTLKYNIELGEIFTIGEQGWQHQSK